MRVALILPLMLLAAVAPAADGVRHARAAAEAAARRAAALDARADASPVPAERARWQRAAVEARVAGAEAEIAAGTLRHAAIAQAVAAQDARLAAQQGPIARLLAALTSFVRRPAPVMLAQPGSVADLVHVQAVLRTTLPAVRQRTATLRDALWRTRALEASAAEAAARLSAGRARLLEAQAQLAALDGGDDAVERVLALGEAVRETTDGLRAIGGQQAILADVAALPGPPVARIARPRGVAAYRLPVAGRLVTGLGEVSDNGVRARGLTFAVPAGSPVIAPAAGRIGYARAFRGYDRIVILDHGDGWTTLITGLGMLAVAAGDRVTAGDVLARAGAGGEVTVELRRHGQPMDIAQLIG